MTSVSWKDTPLILIVSLALCGESILLLHQMRVVDLPWNLGRAGSQGEIVGRVLERKNEVRNRAEGSLTWYPTGAGDSVHQEDTLLTGPEGSARVSLFPEGELILGPNSMIRFSQTKMAGELPVLSLKVRRGNARVASRSKRLAVQVQSRELSMDAESAITVTASDLEDQTRVEVQSGALRERTNEFVAGEAIEIEADRAPTAIALPLRFEEQKPSPGELVTSEAPMLFTWTGDAATQIEIAFEPEFKSPTRHSAADFKAEFPLSPGVYYWRLRENDRTSRHSTFTLRPPVEMIAKTPTSRQVFKGGEAITLRWNRVGIAAGYFVQLSQDPGFKAILYEKSIGTPALKTPNLKRGQYFWRVRAEHPQFGTWPFSETFEFSVKDRLAPPKTKGVKVLEKKSALPPTWQERAEGWLSRVAHWLIPEAHAAEPTVRLYFEWKPVEGAEQYQFELSRSAKFQKIYRKERTRNTQVSAEVNVNQVFYWRVRGIDDEGGLGAPSVAQQIRPRRLLEIYQASGGDDSEDGIKMDKTPNFYSVGLGGSGGYHFQNINGTTGVTENRGIPLNRGELKLLAGSLTRPWEARVWYQSRRYTSANSELSGVQSDLRHPLVGGQLLWHSPWRLGLPLRLGAQVEYLPVLRRTGVTTAVVGSELYYGLIFGGTISRLVGENWRLTGDFFVEGSPFGRVKGVGGIFRGRVSHSGLNLSALGMVAGPELEVGFNPSYRWAAPDNRSVFTLDFNFTLYLTVQFLG